ncbi:hypothetical protein NM688_g505 [Phlebia brevispora]|uniref:Uncharacterized protein n=1 Tax=Phlebia brevispora TaxID=194682 RepID=A0ACC1TDU3_9APHY|nr:hypothetical protein NM688_g505 [Phlebia brevispora]
MSRRPSSRDYLVNLAKQQLDYPTSVSIGTGYGVVTCLEDGCLGAKIPLIACIDAPNGGSDVGIGSLSAYRAHISGNENHEKSRNARVSRGEGQSLSHMHMTAPATLLRPAAHAWSQPFGLAYAAPFGQSSTAGHLPYTPSSINNMLKPEPVEPVLSSAGFHSHVKPEPLEFAGFDASDRKRVKSEPGAGFGTPNDRVYKEEAPKTPLAALNRDDSFTFPAAHHHPAQVAENSADDTREKLSEVQSHIMNVEAKLNKAESKPNKSKADFTRIGKLRNELAELKALKDKYNSSLPSIKPVSRTGSGGVRLLGSPVKPSVGSSSVVALPPPTAFYNPAYSHGIVTAANNVHVNIIPHSNAVASGSNVKLEAPALKTEIDLNPNDNVEFNFQKLTAGVPGFTNYNPDDERFDNDGDFYGRGKDHFAGPVAKADDIDRFLIAAGNAEQFDGNASVDRALQKLGLADMFQPLPGMEIALMPHQAIGVAWMLEKERGPLKGGCLADEMGLGKTVQMIATIVSNPSKDPLRKTTLIVSPLALLDQWQQEIELKTNLGYKCLLHHGPTLSYEWPDEEAEEREKRRRKKKRPTDGFIVDDSDEDIKPKLKARGRKTLGPLLEFEAHRPVRYRVVLDEAQNVRNKRTRVSRAVTKLEATYRWCLTGTPIINGLADAYAQIRFLRVRPWHDWHVFNGHITLQEKKRPELATSRLQAIFATMLLRRKKDSMLDGQKLIELPSKLVRLIKLQFTQEERDIYKMVESRSQEIFNRYLRAGTVLKNYHQVLVLLLRLRQICAHPSLITESGEAFVRPGEPEETDGAYAELVRAQRIMGLDFVLRMKDKFKRVTLERMQAEKESADATLEGEDYECPICFDSYTEAVITPCGHTFCRECIMSVLNGVQREDANEQNQYQHDERPCPTCRGAITKERLFPRAAFEPTDAELRAEGAAVPGQQLDKDGDVEMTFMDEDPKPQPGRLQRKRKAPRYADSDSEDDGDDLSDFIVDDDEDEEEAARVRGKVHTRGKGKARAIILSDDEGDADVICGARPDYAPEQIKMMPKFLPSTKMKHMMEMLRKWAEEHPDEKVLIISQWTSCLQLVSDYLTENKFLHVKYQGDMIRSKRDTAVRVFMAKDKATVMLMSMKCGGVGLNLTRANRVISLDLGWSEAVEAQAFDRVHRLGQSREVFVERLVIADTVEDRILALQERKKLLADCSLGEGTGKKLGRLSVKELANLFGLDHRGRVIAPA